MATNTKKRTCWHLTLNKILTILCTVAITIVLGIYAALSSEQQSDQTRQFDLETSSRIERTNTL